MPMSSFRVLCVHGSTHADSKLSTLMEIAANAAQQAGAQIEHFNLSEHILPVMKVGCPEQKVLPSVIACRKSAAAADAFLLGTPEYHGAMSGALKNWFDFLYTEFAGKMAAGVCTTGAGNGDLPLTAIMTSIAWCHGFALPFRVTASSQDFNEQGQITNERVLDRAARIGADLVRYGQSTREAFEQAKQAPQGPSQGFAGFHCKGN